jgi:hypothetical protein
VISVFILGALGTGFACQLAMKEVARKDHERFVSQADLAKENFDREKNKYSQAIGSVGEWMGWIETPTLTEWENRLEQMNFRTLLPALGRVGYSPSRGFMSRWQGRIPKHWPETWSTIDHLRLQGRDALSPPNAVGQDQPQSRLFYDTRLGDWNTSISEPPISKGDILPVDCQPIFLHSNSRLQAGMVR